MIEVEKRDHFFSTDLVVEATEVWWQKSRQGCGEFFLKGNVVTFASLS